MKETYEGLTVMVIYGQKITEPLSALEITEPDINLSDIEIIFENGEGENGEVVQIGDGDEELENGDEEVQNDSDSEDSDYEMECEPTSDSDSDSESDDASWLYEGLEGPDDDIFDINSHNRVNEQPRSNVQQVDEEANWYSEPENDDELKSLKGSDDDESHEQVEFNEKVHTKNPELICGMKFPTVQTFRKYLKEWNVVHGYDIEFDKNESNRITAKCRLGCTWRIHASKVGKEATFAIKTIKAYSYMIHPVPDIYEYVQTGLQPLNPPLAKKLGGRPKKARNKQADEPSAKKKGDEQIASRKNLNVTCGKCLQVGHNKRTCKNRLHPKSKMMKRSGHACVGASSSQPTPRQAAPVASSGQRLLTQPPKLPTYGGKGKGVATSASGSGQGRGVGVPTSGRGQGRGVGMAAGMATSASGRGQGRGAGVAGSGRGQGRGVGVAGSGRGQGRCVGMAAGMATSTSGRGQGRGVGVATGGRGRGRGATASLSQVLENIRARKRGQVE
ncbi:hypothetical protein RHGRI_016740 [Rhododendron griersonianum]|uniref:Transposase MuDR plant domain-containing protein n=1 Tax=Rhododendron griersonianum TaxID=479676 RepID=A0AAV6JVB5_9ERIC|nr:hypothetical protein RHGRI_016740 [Rhododendron griersonianum]